MRKQDLKTNASDINRPYEQHLEVKLAKKASKFFTQNVICRIHVVREAMWESTAPM